MRTPRIKINLLSSRHLQGKLPARKGRSGRLVRRVLWFWNWSERWPWFSSLFFLGLGIIALDEYALSICFFCLSAFGVISKLIHWNNPEVSAVWKNAPKVAGSIGIVLALAMFIYVINDVRGSKPWSHLQTTVERYVDNKWFSFSADAIRIPVLSQQLQPPIAPAIENVPTAQFEVPATAPGTSRPLVTAPPIHRTESFITYVLYSESDNKYPLVCPMVGQSLLRAESCGNIMRVASQAITDRQQQVLIPSIAAIIQHYFAALLVAAGWDSAQQNPAPVGTFNLKPLPTIDVPDAEPRTLERVLAVTDSDRQLFPKEFSLESKVTLPKNSQILFVHIPVSENPESFLMQIQRPGYYKAVFGVHIYHRSAEGEKPEAYEVSPFADRHLITYVFSITLDYAIERKADPEFIPTDYADWIKALFENMRVRLEN